MGGDQPFVGMLLLVPYNFAPQGWAFCAGQLLAIAENDTLFNLIGTTYGGDGQSTFGLPDLLGRTPIHAGSNGAGNYIIGQKGGVESVILTPNQIPMHSHTVVASSNNQNSINPSGNVFAATDSGNAYDPATGNKSLAAAALSSDGGSQPHENMSPYLVLNFIIALQGIFPSQN